MTGFKRRYKEMEEPKLDDKLPFKQQMNERSLTRIVQQISHINLADAMSAYVGAGGRLY